MAERTLSMAVPPVAKPIVLHDGSTVDLMPIEPSDEQRLVRFHHGLSRDTIRRRFFHPELTDAELRRFTHVDHVNREAIVAVADGEIIAVAGSIESTRALPPRWRSSSPTVGRAVDWDSAAVSARRPRSPPRRTRLVAETLVDNRHMLAVFHHAGLPITERTNDGIVELTISLTDTP